jgi:hypothetical protein
MAAVSLEALEKSTLPPPIAVISGIEIVNERKEAIATRLPPPVRPRGSHFSLEELEPEKSYNTKQTLVVERETILNIGGWDEAFRSRVHSDLFLRLNPVCSIVGLSMVTYQLYSHGNKRVSRHPILRQESFKRLLDKHEEIFRAHPKMFAHFVCEHALMSYRLGQKREAFLNLCWAMQLAPIRTFLTLSSPLRAKLKF